MKSRRKMGLLVAALVLLAGLCFLLWPDGGPRYQGQPVSFWFRQYYLLDHGRTNRTSEQIEEAFANLGTNALPYLVGQALSTRGDTAFRVKLYGALQKLPAFLHVPPYVSYADMREHALSAIDWLKPPGPVILPMVEKALEGTDVSRQLHAARIVCRIERGKDVLIPPMARLLHNKDGLVQGIALEWIRSLGPAGKAAVPDLAQMLLESEDLARLRHEALLALAEIGSDAKAAVPALQKLFATETNWPARGFIASTLCRIDAEQTAALNYLVATMETRDVKIPTSRSHEAANFLGGVGRNAKAATPALVDWLDSRDTELVVAVVGALKKIGEENASFLPKLEARLNNGSETDRLEIAKCILSVDPSNQAAQSALVSMVKKQSGNSLLAIHVLSAATPMAPETVAVLREARASEDLRIRNAASLSLTNIGALQPYK